MAGLLGHRPSRHFKIYREEAPAIFRFNGKLYVEDVYHIDRNEIRWVEISEKEAMQLLNIQKAD